MIIYKITNKINNKIYIGQTTKTAEQRFNKHWNEACCKSRPNNYFHNALIQYGKENFLIEVIDTANSLEELNDKEIYWIEKLDSCNKEKGYNLMPGGKSGIKSLETRQKISEKKKENWQNQEFAEKCLAGLRKGTEVWQNKCESNKIEIECEYCHKKFKVPPYEAKTRKYCSNECANAVNIQKATIAAAEKKKERFLKIHSDFKQEILEWCNNNKELVLNCPNNKISTTLSEIQNIAITKYNFSDWRSISKAICGSQSKKELLIYLKENCENVR